MMTDSDARCTLDELLTDQTAALRARPGTAVRLLSEIGERQARLSQLQAILVVRAAGSGEAQAPADGLLTMEQVAERLNVPVAYARELGRRGELPILHVGAKHVRVRESSLSAWIAQHEESLGAVPTRAYSRRPKRTNGQRATAPVVSLRQV